MKKTISILALIALTACSGGVAPDGKFFAGSSPEHGDDFVWENSRICYRVAGRGSEKDFVSPGFDVFVKDPGTFIGRSLDTHKTRRCRAADFSAGLGAGASAVLFGGDIVLSPTNYRSAEVLYRSDDRMVFVLHYPKWKLGNDEIWLDKQITLLADSDIFEVADYYNGYFDHITVAAGLDRTGSDVSGCGDDGCGGKMISVLRHTPEDCVLGGTMTFVLAAPDCDTVIVDGPGNHSVALKRVIPNEPFVYWTGSFLAEGYEQADVWLEQVVCAVSEAASREATTTDVSVQTPDTMPMMNGSGMNPQ